MTSHIRTFRKFIPSVLLALTFICSAAVLRAQSTQTQTPPPDQKAKTEEQKKEEEKKAKVTEEMTVTARKREETVQEVPISVAAPTESELRDRGAQTIEDVANNVAGFTVQNL